MTYFMNAAVIGHPIGHSLSPKIHNKWLKTLGIKGFYTAFEVKPENLEIAVRAMQKLQFRGCNVTVPHKENILKIADDISLTAQKVGAANTIIFEDDKILADNTDVYGFSQYLLQRIGQRTYNRVVVLGAGGAARAIVVSLLQMDVDHIVIINRNVDRAENVAQMDERITVNKWSDQFPSDIDLMVNTTSLGLEFNDKPLVDAAKHLSADCVAMDIVYKPLKTNFLKQAEANGAHIVDGLGMLVHQAVPAFKQFFHQQPSVTIDDIMLLSEEVG